MGACSHQHTIHAKDGRVSCQACGKVLQTEGRPCPKCGKNSICLEPGTLKCSSCNLTYEPIAEYPCPICHSAERVTYICFRTDLSGSRSVYKCYKCTCEFARRRTPDERRDRHDSTPATRLALTRDPSKCPHVRTHDHCQKCNPCRALIKTAPQLPAPKRLSGCPACGSNSYVYGNGEVRCLDCKTFIRLHPAVQPRASVHSGYGDYDGLYDGYYAARVRDGVKGICPICASDVWTYSKSGAWCTKCQGYVMAWKTNLHPFQCEEELV